MKAKLIAAAALLAATPLVSLADEKCTETPKEQWLRPEQVQSSLQAKGYDVRRVKREGTCYEVKATKEGKRISLHVNPADGTIVRQKQS